MRQGNVPESPPPRRCLWRRDHIAELFTFLREITEVNDKQINHPHPTCPGCLMVARRVLHAAVPASWVWRLAPCGRRRRRCPGRRPTRAASRSPSTSSPYRVQHPQMHTLHAPSDATSSVESAESEGCAASAEGHTVPPRCRTQPAGASHAIIASAQARARDTLILSCHIRY